jgi:hypothetical protein
MEVPQQEAQAHEKKRKQKKVIEQTPSLMKTQSHPLQPRKNKSKRKGPEKKNNTKK